MHTEHSGDYEHPAVTVLRSLSKELGRLWPAGSDERTRLEKAWEVSGAQALLDHNTPRCSSPWHCPCGCGAHMGCFLQADEIGRNDPLCAECGWEKSHVRHHSPVLYNFHEFQETS